MSSAYGSNEDGSFDRRPVVGGEYGAGNVKFGSGDDWVFCSSLTELD